MNTLRSQLHHLPFTVYAYVTEWMNFFCERIKGKNEGKNDTGKNTWKGRENRSWASRASLSLLCLPFGIFCRWSTDERERESLATSSFWNVHRHKHTFGSHIGCNVFFHFLLFSSREEYITLLDTHRSHICSNQLLLNSPPFTASSHLTMPQ